MCGIIKIAMHSTSKNFNDSLNCFSKIFLINGTRNLFHKIKNNFTIIFKASPFRDNPITIEKKQALLSQKQNLLVISK